MRAWLRLAEERQDTGDGPSCAAVGWGHPEKRSLTMDMSDCSGCLPCRQCCSLIPSSSCTGSPHTVRGNGESEEKLCNHNSVTAKDNNFYFGI